MFVSCVSRISYLVSRTPESAPTALRAALPWRAAPQPSAKAQPIPRRTAPGTRIFQVGQSLHPEGGSPGLSWYMAPTESSSDAKSGAGDSVPVDDVHPSMAMQRRGRDAMLHHPNWIDIRACHQPAEGRCCKVPSGPHWWLVGRVPL